MVEVDVVVLTRHGLLDHGLLEPLAWVALGLGLGLGSGLGLGTGLGSGL